MRIGTRIALVMACVPLLHAQTASVSGTVADPSGAAIPTAKVAVTNTATSFSLTRQCDPGGAFAFPQLPVGPYTLKVSADGFQPYIQTGIVLTVDQVTNIPVKLNLGSATESITVAANVDLLNVSTPTLSQVIEQSRIEALPLNGRNPAALVLLTAGVADAKLNAGGGSAVFQGPNSYPSSITVAANGTRGGSSYFTLDGVLNMDNYQMAAAPFPNPDTTQEFSVLTSSYNARYGFAAGGVVNIVTRSGSNQFHGNVFEFDRNGVLNARDFYAERHDNLKRDQFGGTAGFPILRDKLFFFGSYQGTRLRNIVEGVQRQVPTAAMRTGDFSALLPRTVVRDPVTRQPYPGNQIPVSSFSPVSTRMLDLLPVAPTANGIFVTSLPDRYSEDEMTLKTDWNQGMHRFSWRYFLTRYTDPGLLATKDLTRAVQPQDKSFQSVMFGDTWTIGPNLINDFRVAYSRLGSQNSPAVTISPTQLGVNMTEGAIPFIQTFNMPGLAIGTGTRNNFPRSNFNLEESVLWIRGKHQLTLGTQMVRVARLVEALNGQNGQFVINGQFSGNGFSDFLLGAVSQFGQSDGALGDMRGWLWGFYAQDDWKATSNLTLNLGLRYDPHFPYHEANGRQACWRPGMTSEAFANAPLGYLAAGDRGCPAAGTGPDLNNIEPRVGFAYNVLGLNRWSLRGGYGLYYEPLGTFFNTVDLGQTPFSRSFQVLPSGNRPISLDNPWRDFPGGDPFASGFLLHQLPSHDTPFPQAPFAAFSWPENFRLSYAQNWSLSLERTLGTDMLIRAAYVGSKSTDLSYSRDINMPVAAPNATAGNVQQRRPLRAFSQFLMFDDGGNSSYQAMQLTFQRRFAKNFSLLSDYTFGKSIDETSTNASFFKLASTLINSNDRSAQRGVSDFDLTHSFRTSTVWQGPRLASQPALLRTLFGNWGLNSIWIWRSGLPFSIISGQDRSFTGTGLDLADTTSAATALPSGRSRGEQVKSWFNTSAFAPNAPGTFGNAGRNSMRGPSRFNIDLGVTRRFNLPKEGLSLQFRAEFFNVLNHTQLGQPVASLVNQRFGQITAAADPRILQFAAKLQW